MENCSIVLRINISFSVLYWVCVCVLYLFTKTVSNALLYIFETGCGSCPCSYVLVSYVHECNNVLYIRLYASVGLSSLFALKKKASPVSFTNTTHQWRGKHCSVFFSLSSGGHCCSVNHFLWNHHLNLRRYATVVNGLIGLSPFPAPCPLFQKKKPCASVPSS